MLVPVRGPTAPGYYMYCTRYLLVLPGTTVLLLILILIPSTVVRVLPFCTCVLYTVRLTALMLILTQQLYYVLHVHTCTIDYM